MADDDRRVEARLNLVGRGSGTTPERIAELQARAREVEKLSRKPSKSFGALVNSVQPTEPSEDEKKRTRGKKASELAKKPRPGLAHPGQRQTFGRDDEKSHESIVIKG
jgi:hypothetical protein